MSLNLKHIVLESQLKVLLIPLKSRNNISISLSFNVGNIDENKKQTGICHLLEHIICLYLSKNTMINKIRSEGGYIYSNAYTNDYRTSYYYNSNNLYLEDLIQVLYQIYFIKKLDKNLLIKEKKAIEVELKQILSDKDKYAVYKSLPLIMFGDTPIVLDPEEHLKNLSKITEKDLLKFMKENYTLENSVILISGDFDSKNILKIIKNKFNFNLNGCPSNRLSNRIELFNKIKMPKTRYVFVKSVVKKVNSVYLHFFINDVHNYKKKGVFEVLKVLLSKLSDESILFKVLRSKYGLTYSSHIMSEFNNHYGGMIIHYTIDPKKLDSVLKKTVSILNNLDDYINTNNLKSAKNKLFYDLNLKLSNNDPSKFQWYLDMIHNDQLVIDSLTFYNKYIKTVSKKDIIEFYKDTFTSNNCYLCVVGVNPPNKKDLLSIIKNLD